MSKDRLYGRRIRSPKDVRTAIDEMFLTDSDKDVREKVARYRFGLQALVKQAETDLQEYRRLGDHELVVHQEGICRGLTEANRLLRQAMLNEYPSKPVQST